MVRFQYKALVIDTFFTNKARMEMGVWESSKSSGRSMCNCPAAYKSFSLWARNKSNLEIALTSELPMLVYHLQCCGWSALSRIWLSWAVLEGTYQDTKIICDQRGSVKCLNSLQFNYKPGLKLLNWFPSAGRSPKIWLRCQKYISLCLLQLILSVQLTGITSSTSPYFC